MAHRSILQEYAGMEDLSVDVLTSCPEPEVRVEQFAENITIYKVGIHKKNLQYWRKLEVIEWLFSARGYYRRLLDTNRYDLVHAFFGFPTGYLCYKTADRLPYIISLRGSDVPGHNARLGVDYMLLSPLFRKIWRNASAVIANSKGLRKLAHKFMPELEIGVIHNGVCTDRFFPGQQNQLSEPVKLLTVSRLVRTKRLDLLVKTVARLKELGINVELNIAGQGNAMNELKKLANSLDVSGSVNLMGRVSSDQTPQMYRDSDIFLMSSAHEGMSNAMLEAMATALPVVTTQCEGVEELISGRGIVLKEASVEQMCSAIMRLIDKRDVYNDMSKALRKRAEELTWSSVAGKYLDCYHSVAGGGGEN